MLPPAVRPAVCGAVPCHGELAIALLLVPEHLVLGRQVADGAVEPDGVVVPGPYTHHRRTGPCPKHARIDLFQVWSALTAIERSTSISQELAPHRTHRCFRMGSMHLADVHTHHTPERGFFIVIATTRERAVKAGSAPRKTGHSGHSERCWKGMLMALLDNLFVCEINLVDAAQLLWLIALWLRTRRRNAG